MKPLALFLFLLLLAPASLAQGEASVTDMTQEANDLVATLEEAGDFSILVGALHATGLADALTGPDAYTLFAPTDEAFGKVPGLDAMSPDELAEILRYHLLPGVVSSSEAAALASAATVQGEALTLAATGDALTVNGAVVIEADIAASNGVIHAVDTVLMPESDEPATEREMKHRETGGEPAHDHVSESPPETDDAY